MSTSYSVVWKCVESVEITALAAWVALLGTQTHSTHTVSFQLQNHFFLINLKALRLIPPVGFPCMVTRVIQGCNSASEITRFQTLKNWLKDILLNIQNKQKHQGSVALNPDFQTYTQHIAYTLYFAIRCVREISL